MPADRKYSAAYYIRNREVLRAKQRQYYVKHSDRIKDQSRAWREARPEAEMARDQHGHARARELRLIRRYGLTQEQYDSMLADQGNLCAVGGSRCEGEELYVDHDHETERVRGLLCQKCNSVLGYARDQVGILRNAINYLLGGTVYILEQMKLSPAQATEMYVKLRDAKAEKDKAHKESLTKIVAAMDRLEAGLLEHLNVNGINSVASDAGTAYRSTQLSATIEDKEAFRKFVIDTEQWEAVDLKANKTFVAAYMEENEEVPPGVKVSQMQTIGVQRK